MGIDILLCIILVGFFCICGGFASYGFYRCCTDKESRVASEDSLKKRGAQKHQKKSRFWDFFRKPDKCKNYSRNSSLTSFNGTIYTVTSAGSSAGLCRENDGKVPFDLLDDAQIQVKPSNINPNPSQRVEKWRLENEVERPKGILKTNELSRAKTAPT